MLQGYRAVRGVGYFTCRAAGGSVFGVAVVGGRVARRWCTEGGKAEVGVPKARSTVDASKAHDRFMRKVMRETRRISRASAPGAAHAVEEVLDPQADAEQSEKMYAKTMKQAADERGSVLGAVYWTFRAAWDQFGTAFMLVFFFSMWVYSLVKVPQYGDSLPYVPGLMKAIFWDGLVINSREATSSSMQSMTTRIKKWLFPAQYNY